MQINITKPALSIRSMLLPLALAQFIASYAGSNMNVQTVRGYNAIQIGLILTPATIGILLSSITAVRLAKKYFQRTLIWAGFVTTIVGMILLLLLIDDIVNNSLPLFTP
jgi:MFS family permease